MTTSWTRAAALAAALACQGSALAATQNPQDNSTTRSGDMPVLEELRVLDRRPVADDTLDPDSTAIGSVDVGRALARLPGVDTNANGPLTTQMQYRGLFGPRLAVRLDGMALLTGGPNWMDPPLHYVPRGLLHAVRMPPGPGRVSDGGFGGVIDASWKQPDFTTGGWQPYLDIDSAAQTGDSGWSSAAVMGASSARQRLHLALSSERGDDYRTGRGHLEPTEYLRRAAGLGWGWRDDEQAFELSVRRIETDDAGTPALPMDIEFFRTDLVRARWQRSTGWGEIEALVGFSEIDHAMNNFAQRPTPNVSDAPLPPFDGPDARRTLAQASSREARLILTRPLADADWRSGLSWQSAAHDARINDPDFTPFFVDNFADVTQDTLALFTELDLPLGSAWQLRAGARLARVRAAAGAVDAFPARLVDADPGAWPAGTPPRGLYMLRERFNAADRARTDLNVDAELQLERRLSDRDRLSLALTRRTRSPSFIERWVWLPLAVNAGLSDGNNYVGDPDLRPEVAHQLELAWRHQGSRAHWSLRAHYRHVDDYIGGDPSTDPLVIAMSTNVGGDPTPMRFSNLEARLWGVDGQLAMALGERLQLEVAGSWLDTERSDNGDGLFRAAPPDLRARLNWRQGRLNAFVEQQWVLRQDALARVLLDDPANTGNRLAEVDGYRLTHLGASWRGGGGWQLDVGVENLFDASWEDPSGGLIQVSGARRGERMPGRGRNLYARVHYRLPR